MTFDSTASGSGALPAPVVYDGSYESSGRGKSIVPKSMTAKDMFALVGFVVLALICLVPIWNAALLLSSSNYVFWAGVSVPVLMILFCVAVILLYLYLVHRLFNTSMSIQSDQGIITVAHGFMTLFGITFLLFSLPLIRQSMETYNNLMYRCEYSDQTHGLAEYSQVLGDMRAMSDCRPQESVEMCVGYFSYSPYTKYLKNMEASMRCSGFCAKSTRSPAVPPVNGTTVLTEFKGRLFQNRRVGSPHSVGLLAAGTAPTASHVARRGSTSDAPLPLFSNRTTDAFCAGLAAQDFSSLSGSVGKQTFFHGIYLLVVAIVLGFQRLLGMCMAGGMRMSTGSYPFDGKATTIL